MKEEYFYEITEIDKEILPNTEVRKLVEIAQGVKTSDKSGDTEKNKQRNLVYRSAFINLLIKGESTIIVRRTIDARDKIYIKTQITPATIGKFFGAYHKGLLEIDDCEVKHSVFSAIPRGAWVDFCQKAAGKDVEGFNDSFDTFELKSYSEYLNNVSYDFTQWILSIESLPYEISDSTLNFNYLIRCLSLMNESDMEFERETIVPEAIEFMYSYDWLFKGTAPLPIFELDEINTMLGSIRLFHGSFSEPDFRYFSCIMMYSSFSRENAVCIWSLIEKMFEPKQVFHFASKALDCFIEYEVNGKEILEKFNDANPYKNMAFAEFLKSIMKKYEVE